MGEVEGDSPLHSQGSLVRVLTWVKEKLPTRKAGQESALPTVLSSVLQG